VNRCNKTVILHGPKNRLIQQMDPVKALGENCLKTHRRYVFKADDAGTGDPYGSGFAAPKAVQKTPYPPAVIGDMLPFLVKGNTPAGISVVIDRRPGAAHPFHPAFTERTLCGHIEKFKFKGSAPRIAYQNQHG
jgi:hypothetical protein